MKSVAALILGIFAVGAYPCRTSMYDANMVPVCVDPCNESTVSYNKQGTPTCLVVEATGKVCPPESVSFDVQGDPLCMKTESGHPCPSSNIYYTPDGPICLPIGSPQCQSVAYLEGYPTCMPCDEEKVFYGNTPVPMCLPVGEDGCLTVQYVHGDPICFPCESYQLFFGEDSIPYCLPVGEPGCLSVGWNNGRPICLSCEVTQLIYVAGTARC